MAKHIYIIDTCVLLHDPLALYKFADNDIYIPLAVIDDMDDIMKYKKGSGQFKTETLKTADNIRLYS